MKKVNLSKKLSLKKETIASLNFAVVQNSGDAPLATDHAGTCVGNTCASAYPGGCNSQLLSCEGGGCLGKTCPGAPTCNTCPPCGTTAAQCTCNTCNC